MRDTQIIGVYIRVFSLPTRPTRAHFRLRSAPIILHRTLRSQHQAAVRVRRTKNQHSGKLLVFCGDRATPPQLRVSGTGCPLLIAAFFDHCSCTSQANWNLFGSRRVQLVRLSFVEVYKPARMGLAAKRRQRGYDYGQVSINTSRRG